MVKCKETGQNQALVTICYLIKIQFKEFYRVIILLYIQVDILMPNYSKGAYF